MAPGGGQTTVGVTVAANMDVGGVLSAVKQMQGAFNGLKIPANLTTDVLKDFDKLRDSLSKFKSISEKSTIGKADVKALNKLQNEIDSTFSHLESSLQDLSSQKHYLDVDYTKIKDAEAEVSRLKSDLQTKLGELKFDLKLADSNGSASLGINKIVADMEKGVKSSKVLSAAMAEVGKSVQLGNFAAAGQKLTEIQNKAISLKGASAGLLETFRQWGIISFDGPAKQLVEANKHTDLLRVAFEKLGPVFAQDQQSIINLVKEIKNAEAAKQQLEKTGQQHFADELNKTASAAHNLSVAEKEAANSSIGVADGVARAADEVKQLQQSTQYFFSLRNMINLLKQGIREAVQTVKELDAAMTETAVVTDYSVSDMWSMLPQYTAQANKLGATIQDMYESTTLYYQQGLETEAAMGIAAETMKMARIAGLEAKDATDMMTAALRGFNMELDNTSAQRINDVYSNLAAKTASDTNELGTAMQRTASIAYSAGMSFEGTAAFLAQAIETTREPAENIGTAMKTIVARFQEMKKNPLEITEVDGEEVSYNKVDTALQSIGVSLKDTNGQFRELDQVFLDISKRWDGLTQTQQRYIATIAAGSRQQSRFIAMMNNYDRTVELMGYANDSEGASAEQFGKTLESLQAKINEFQNAWKQFLMGIMNDVWTKRLVAGGTLVLNTINKIINALSFGGKAGLLKSALSVFTAFTALKGVGRLANRAVGGLGGLIDPTSTGKAGWRNGAIGNGKNLAQAQAISNPIVQAIHQLQAAITGKQASSTGDNGVANYKASLREFRKESKKEGATVSGAFGTLKGLSAQQMQYISRSNAGRMSQIQRSLADTDLGKTVSAQLMTAIGRGQISGNQIASLNKANLGAILGTEDAKAYSDKFSKTVKSDMLPKWEQAQKEVANKIRSQARYKDPEMWTQIERMGGDKVAHEDLIRKYNYDKETGAVTENPLYNEKYAKAFKENIKTIQESNKKLADIGNVQIKPPKALESIKQGISQLGGSAITAGQGLSALGSTLNSMGFETAGLAVSTFGNALTNVGMIATGLPKLLNPVGLAAGAIAAIIFVASKKVKDAKEAAEKTVKDYEKAIEDANKKASTLASARDVLMPLSRGVDEHNNNIGLSTEEYDQYLATAQEVADIAPELIRGYDAQGRAIVDTGNALDALIKKQEEYKEEAAKTFTSNSSINDIVGGIQVSDAFKKIDKNASVYDPNEGVYKTIPKQAQKLEQALSKAGITNFDKISKDLFGHEINLLEPSNEDLHLISAHYNDIYKLLETENSELTDKQKENLQNILSEIGTEWEDAETEVRPLAQAMGQYLSSEGIDTIGLGLGKEFTESFNKGLDSLAMTAALEGWEAPQIKNAAREYAEGFKEMTKDGSEYATIMEQVTAKQEEFNESIGEEGAIENYQGAVEEYAIQLEELADKYDDGTVAGELFANSLREQAGTIRNYATESTVTLGEALNTLSDEFESARGAKERFEKAMEKGDYYTAAEGFKSIADTVLDDKNKGGNGSIAGWTGAEELLGQNYIDTHSWKEIVAQVEKISGTFEDGLPGVQKFGDLLVENADKLKGLGKLNKETGQFEFDFKNLDNLKEYADILGMSEDALAALIDKSRQWVAWDLSNPSQVRQALEQTNQAMSGVTKKGRNMLYTSETAFRQEAHQQGIYGDDLARTQKNLYDNENVRFLTVENLTTKKGKGLYADTVLENIGLKKSDKTLDNAVAAFAKMGFDLEETKEILTADGIKLADGKATEEQVEKAYKENEFALENPTVAGIANDTGTLVDNSSAMLASMGILNDNMKARIEEETSNDTNQPLIDNLSKDFTNSADRNKAISAAEEQIEKDQALMHLLEQGGLQDSQQYLSLANAVETLQGAIDNEAQAWSEATTAAQSEVYNLGSRTSDQNWLNNNAVDVKNIFDSTALTDGADALAKIKEQGDLTQVTIDNLTNKFLALHATELLPMDDTQFIRTMAQFGIYGDEVDHIRQLLQQPFVVQTQLTGDDLKQYVENIDNLTAEEKSIILRAYAQNENKVIDLINAINKEFGNESEETKTIILQATAKLASGDTEGAHNLLQEQFGDKTEEVETKLGIICNGSIANPTEVKNAIESEIEDLNVGADVKANIKVDTSNIKLNQKGSVNYVTSVDDTAIKDARKNAEKGATMPIKGDNKGALTSADSAVAKINRKEATLDVYMNQAGSWKATVTVEKDARGRNYSIPASHSLSFGSAAQGMNIPKPKKTGGSQVTALVGEEGFEVGYIPSERRSVIFGANGPEMTSFPSDTIIYPHDQSKKIMRRGKGKHVNAGSFEYGNTGNSGGIPTTKDPGRYGGSASNIVIRKEKEKSKSSEKAAKETIKVTQKAGKVLVWWENMGRRVDKVQRDADKNQKSLDRLLKVFGTTAEDYKKAGEDLVKNLNTSINLAAQRKARAESELKTTVKGPGTKKITDAEKKSAAAAKKRLDAAKADYKKAKKTKGKGDDAKAKKALDRAQKKYDNNKVVQKQKENNRLNQYAEAIGARQTVSYEVTETKKNKKGKKTKTKKTKNKTINLSKYIKWNEEAGMYEINQAAIDKEAGKNKSLGEAIKQAADKQLNDLYSKIQSAEDDEVKATEELAEFYNSVYDTFYSWEKTITEAYLLSQKLQEISSFRDINNAAEELEFAKLEAGFGNLQTGLLKVNEVLEQNRQSMLEQVQANALLVDARHAEYLAALSNEKEMADFLANPDSENAAYALDVKNLTLSFLKEIGQSENFDYQAAVNTLNSRTWNKDDYDKIQEGLDNIADKQSSYYDAVTQTYQSMTEVYQTIEEYQSYMADFESSLISGLEEQANKEIDKLSKINSSIDNAAKELIDEVKRKLDERRKQEDNAKTEQDIAQKQQRLAALRADTSGGHQVEIAQLEKEIAEAQQNYGRTLEDQLLDRLSQQQDEAAKQRERQISLLEAQRDLASALGTNVEEVNKWLQAPEQNYDKVRAAWLENQGYSDKGAQERKQLEEQFDSAWLRFLAYGTALPKLEEIVQDSSLSEETPVLSPVESINGKMDEVISVLKEERKNQPITTGQYNISDLKNDEEGNSRSVEDIKRILESNGQSVTTKDFTNEDFDIAEVMKAFSVDELYNEGYKVNDLTKYKSLEELSKFYSAQEFGQGGVAYSDAKKYFGLDELAESEIEEYITQANADIAKQAAIKAYKTKITDVAKDKKLDANELKQVQKAAKSAGYGERTFLQDLANTSQLTWTDVIKAAKSAGWNKYRMVLSFNSSTFKKGFENVYGKGQYAKILAKAKDKKKKPYVYKTGGLADSTGPAWLDGTPSKPELVLNSKDTKNFIALKDVLSHAMSSANHIENSYGGDATYEININVDHLNNDYDVDKVVERVKKKIVQDSGYRNVTQVRKFR